VKKIGAVLLVVIVVSAMDAQRVPANRNAKLLEAAHVPAEVRSTIERACRDCHSDATRYPWYSYIAPVSWLVKRDVARGRERLNFSKWGEYSLVRKQRYLSEIANQVQDGGMPLAIYTFMHSEARLSKADVEAVFEWTQAERTRLIMENAAVAAPNLRSRSPSD
jgi:Haem-binding domain